MRRTRKLDPAVICSRLEAGELNVNLAREYGVTAGAISNCARRADYKNSQTRARPNAKTSLAQRADIVARFRAGEKQRALAAEYGVSPARICTIIKADLESPSASSSLPYSGVGASEVSSCPSDAPFSQSCEVL